jgi:hypothetical protein
MLKRNEGFPLDPRVFNHRDIDLFGMLHLADWFQAASATRRIQTSSAFATATTVWPTAKRSTISTEKQHQSLFQLW